MLITKLYVRKLRMCTCVYLEGVFRMYLKWNTQVK